MKLIQSGAAKLKKADWKRIFSEKLKVMGTYWHDMLFPIRFTDSGQNVYHLKQRSYKYIKRVRKMFPNWKPLVRTGHLRSEMISNFRLTPVNKGDNLQAKISMKRPHATQRSVSEELVKVNKSEINKMVTDFKNNVVAESKKG
jgi:hypothetical protein